MSRERALIVLLGLLLAVMAAPSAFAQINGMRARLAVLPDYVQGGADFDGSVVTSDGSRPDLSAWGLVEDAQSGWRPDASSSTWSIRGHVQTARLDKPDEHGVYHLHIGPIPLADGQQVTLVLPFLGVDYAHVAPAPDNLAALTTPIAGNLPPDSLGLSYRGPREVSLDIPFTVIGRQISATVTPLLSDMLQGSTDSYRLSGRVTFSGLVDYGEFGRHCQTTPPALGFPYYIADLLFALDAPPAFNGGLLNSMYQLKPVQLFVRSEVVDCQFQAGSGTVQATFDGRPTIRSTPGNQFPPGWIAEDVLPGNRVVKSASSLPTQTEYELTIGRVQLAPGDSLTLAIPGTQLQVENITPPPSRFRLTGGGTPEIVFDGPRQFVLKIRYTPGPELLAEQLPLVTRGWARAPERTLTAPAAVELGNLITVDVPGALAAALALVSAVAYLAADRQTGARRLQLSVVALAALAVGFWARGIFGMLALAVLLLAYQNRSCRGWWLASAVVFLLVGLAAYTDARAQGLFLSLSTLELDTTPVTPLILLLLSLMLIGLSVPAVRTGADMFGSTQSRMAVVLALAALSVFDVLQRSLLALLLLVAGCAFVAVRLRSAGTDAEPSQVIGRLRSAANSRFVQLGLVLLVVFAAEHGLRTTTAVLGNSLGVWTTLGVPLLLLVSVVESFLAIGLLFVAAYPVVPFKAGYLKAVVFSTWLLLIFVVGVGSDDRLLANLFTLVVGRFVYYLSVPLLLGLYFDIDAFRRTELAKGPDGPPRELTFQKAAATYLQGVQGQLGAASALLGIVAPRAFAAVSGAPLVANYFDLMEKLLKVPIT